ncbi:MAG: hypothetical protein HQ596_01480 [Candidatus Saganbacteria bacterium]|nr:hypothetical protein [Candidatus Saganbacteria bacterium]
MGVAKFSMGDELGFGWNTMKSNFWFFVGFLILMGLVYWIPGAIASFFERSAPFLSGLFNLVAWVLYMIASMGLVKLALGYCDSKKGEFSYLFSSYRLFFKYFFGSLLYGLIVLGGLILFIIPGIIWAIMFQFFPYFVVDKGLGPIEALKKSAAITAGAKWTLFLFGILACLINLLGALCLMVGLFVTIPLTLVAYAAVYRKLLNQAKVTETA